MPVVPYTEDEVKTWTLAYQKLRGFTAKYAVNEFNEVLDLLE